MVKTERSQRLRDLQKRLGQGVIALDVEMHAVGEAGGIGLGDGVEVDDRQTAGGGQAGDDFIARLYPLDGAVGGRGEGGEQGEHGYVAIRPDQLVQHGGVEGLVLLVGQVPAVESVVEEYGGAGGLLGGEQGQALKEHGIVQRLG